MNLLYWICKMSALKAARLFFNLKVIHPERLVPAGAGGTILASNHESFLDPPLVAAAYPDEIHFLARDTLFKGWFGKLIAAVNAVPISQSGADLASLKAIIGEVKKGNRVLIFPEGTRSADGSLQEAAAGVGMIAVKSKAVVQPIRIRGAHKAWPRGEKRIRPVPITLTIGEAIYFTPEELKARSKEQYQAIADRIMAEIARL